MTLRLKLNEHSPLLIVGNKSDQSTNQHEVDVLLSAKTGEGLEVLKDKLGEIMQISNLGKGDTVVTNTRHLEALKATNVKRWTHALTAL